MTIRQRTGTAHRTPRIVAIVMAALLVIAAVYCGINLTAVQSYNQATRSLTSNIKAFQSPNTDLDALRTRQQQTDDQFGEAGIFNRMLLAPVRRPIEINAGISRTLTQRIDSTLARQNKSKTSGSPSSAPSSSPTATDSGSLSNEQRKKVEALLKANEQSTQQGTGQDNGQQSKDQAPVKPW